MAKSVDVSSVVLAGGKIRFPGGCIIVGPSASVDNEYGLVVIRRDRIYNEFSGTHGQVTAWIEGYISVMGE